MVIFLLWPHTDQYRLPCLAALIMVFKSPLPHCLVHTVKRAAILYKYTFSKTPFQYPIQAPNAVESGSGHTGQLEFQKAVRPSGTESKLVTTSPFR
jgi:hypothetical protein